MSEFTDYLPDIFALLGPISIRRMFGGHALYHQGLTFGLVFDETLYPVSYTHLTLPTKA